MSLQILVCVEICGIFKRAALRDRYLVVTSDKLGMIPADNLAATPTSYMRNIQKK